MYYQIHELQDFSRFQHLLTKSHMYSYISKNPIVILTMISRSAFTMDTFVLMELHCPTAHSNMETVCIIPRLNMVVIQKSESLIFDINWNAEEWLQHWYTAQFKQLQLLVSTYKFRSAFPRRKGDGIPRQLIFRCKISANATQNIKVHAVVLIRKNV